MSELNDLIQAYLDRTGVRSAALARKIDTSAQTLDSWKNRGLKQLPDRDLMERLAEHIGVPYTVVLEAVLHDIAYLPDTEVIAARRREADGK